MRLIFRASSSAAAGRTATALNAAGIRTEVFVNDDVHTVAIDCGDGDEVTVIRQVQSLDPGARPFT